MNRAFHRLDAKLNGWLKTALLIIVEVIIVYLLSNIPFFITTLETPVDPEKSSGFISGYINVLSTEIEKGQLLTFVCALIAPVVFWSFVEFRKAVMTKILSFAALILLALSAYLHGRGEDFAYLTSFNLYQWALFIWIVSILSNRIPPDKNAYFRELESQEEKFIGMTRGR